MKLALRALLELVEPSSKNIEIAIITKSGLRTMSNDEVDKFVKAIEMEKKRQTKRRRRRPGVSRGGVGFCRNASLKLSC